MYVSNQSGWVVSDLANAGSTGAFPTFAADEDGQFHIAYIDGYQSTNIVKSITSTDSGWSTPATIDDSGEVLSLSQLAVVK